MLQAYAPTVIIRQQQTVLHMIVEQQHPLPLVLKLTPLPTASVDAPSAKASIATAIQLNGNSIKSVNSSQNMDLQFVSDVGLGPSQHRPVPAVSIHDICNIFGTSMEDVWMSIQAIQEQINRNDALPAHLVFLAKIWLMLCRSSPARLGVSVKMRPQYEFLLQRIAYPLLVTGFACHTHPLC